MNVVIIKRKEKLENFIEIKCIFLKNMPPFVLFLSILVVHYLEKGKYEAKL